jgi:hypothetical protein
MTNTEVETCIECNIAETSSRSIKQNILKESLTGSTLEEDEHSSNSNLDQDSTNAVINSLDEEMHPVESQQEKKLIKPLSTKDSEDENSYGLTEDGLPDPEAKGACHLSCFLYRRTRGAVTHINLDNISCRRLHNPIKHKSR